MNLLHSENITVNGDSVVYEHRVYETRDNRDFWDLLDALFIFIVFIFGYVGCLLTSTLWKMVRRSDIGVDTFDMPYETDDDKYKCVESLFQHIMMCRRGKQCPRRDCRTYKMDLYEKIFEYSDSSDISCDSSSDSSSDSTSDSSSDSSSDYSSNSSGADSKDQSSYNGGDGDKYKYLNSVENRECSSSDDDDEETSDVSACPQSQKIEPAKRSTVEEPTLKKGKKSYSDIYGKWPAMSQQKFISFINMLYDSQFYDWKQPDSLMVEGLVEITGLSYLEIEKWFQNKGEEKKKKSGIAFLKGQREDKPTTTNSFGEKEGNGHRIDNINGCPRFKALFEFLFKSTGWTHPTDHMLKVLKAVSGRRFRVLREIFEQMEKVDYAELDFAMKSGKKNPVNERLMSNQQTSGLAASKKTTSKALSSPLINEKKPAKTSQTKAKTSGESGSFLFELKNKQTNLKPNLRE